MTLEKTQEARRPIDDFLEDIVFDSLVDIKLKEGFEIHENNGNVVQVNSGEQNRYLGCSRGFRRNASKIFLKFALVDGTYTEIEEDQIDCLNSFKIDKTYQL